MSRGTPLGGRIIKQMGAYDRYVISLLEQSRDIDDVHWLLNNQWYFGSKVRWVPHVTRGYYDRNLYFSVTQNVDAFSTIKNMIPRR